MILKNLISFQKLFKFKMQKKLNNYLDNIVDNFYFLKILIRMIL